MPWAHSDTPRLELWALSAPDAEMLHPPEEI